VAHEAVLCPSFYKAQIVFNANRVDTFLWDLQQKVIGWLQDRADRRRLRAA
jgi:indolepyruvate ferredoxin oxidoreductase alpha subunit